jgi:hypothetical protein
MQDFGCYWSNSINYLLKAQKAPQTEETRVGPGTHATWAVTGCTTGHL